MESVVSRVRIAQAAAQAGVDPATAATQMLNHARHPIDYYGDANQNHPVPLVRICTVSFILTFLYERL